MQEYHADTRECFDAWIDYLRLGPHHAPGLERRYIDVIDLNVIAYGKERVIECLTRKRYTSAAVALNYLTMEEQETDRAEIRQKLNGTQKVDQAEVQRLMNQM